MLVPSACPLPFSKPLTKSGNCAIVAEKSNTKFWHIILAQKGEYEMAINQMIKKSQMQVTQAVKKVNYLTLTSYDTTLLLHALQRIEEHFPKKFKYDTNLRGYDGSMGIISIYVENVHEITKILTLIDTCEPIGDKLLSRDLDFSASVTNHPDQASHYEEIIIPNPDNPFLAGWRGLGVEEKKEFIKAFELLDKGNVADLTSVKAGMAANTLTVEEAYGNENSDNKKNKKNKKKK